MKLQTLTAALLCCMGGLAGAQNAPIQGMQLAQQPSGYLQTAPRAVPWDSGMPATPGAPSVPMAQAKPERSAPLNAVDLARKAQEEAMQNARQSQQSARQTSLQDGLPSKADMDREIQRQRQPEAATQMTAQHQVAQTMQAPQVAPPPQSQPPVVPPQARQPQQAATIAMPPSGLGMTIITPIRPEDKNAMPHPSEVIKGAIDDIVNQQFTPEEIEILKGIREEREQGWSQPYRIPPKPVTRTIALNLDSGVPPQPLRLALGMMTSIVFSDYGGNPWQIENVSFNRQLFSDGKSEAAAQAMADGAIPMNNVLYMEPKNLAAYGNVTVKLRGLSTPVIFILTSGQSEVDLRADVMVPGHNPDAAEAVSVSGLPQIDSMLSYFLDNVPPREAKRLRTTGLDSTDAWMYEGQLYVRTKANPAYPAYIAGMRSGTGFGVYRFENPHSSVTLLSDGKAHTLFIEEMH